MNIVIAFLSVASLHAAQLAHPIKGFSVNYDSGLWELVDKKSPQSAIPSQADQDKKTAEQTLFILQQKETSEKYHPRITLIEDTGKEVQKLQGGGTERLRQYENHATQFLKSQRFTIHAQEPKTFANLSVPVVEIVAHQRDFGLKFIQWVFLKNEKAYILTAATRINSFDSFRPEAEKIFASLKFD